MHPGPGTKRAAGLLFLALCIVRHYCIIGTKEARSHCPCNHIGSQLTRLKLHEIILYGPFAVCECRTMAFGNLASW